jgi:hypothetical protein
MSEVHTYIEKCISEDIGPKRVVDVYGVARKVLKEFPHQTLRQLVGAVGAAVAYHRGNAMWDNDHHAAARSAKVRLHGDTVWSGQSLAQEKPLPGYSRQEAILYARDIIVDTGI